MTYSAASLSVIVVSYNARETIGGVLEALAAQTVQGFETVLVDSSTDGTADLVRERFPSVHVHHFRDRMFPGKARNAGLRATGRPLAAFVDADCLADPDWVENMLQAHNSPQGRRRWIVGGSVGVANPGNLDGWASFLCEFTPWLRVGADRAMADQPTCCYSMKREAFERFGPFLEDGYCSDTAFNWKAHAAGQGPWFVPAMHVRHINPPDLARITAKQRMHGEAFARLRAKREAWTWTHARLRAITAPCLPLLLWKRAALQVWRVPEYRRPFLRATPKLARVLAAWSWGEARGYWHAC
jgi:GT2 family glycosyltransferase